MKILLSTILVFIFLITSTHLLFAEVNGDLESLDLQDPQSEVLDLEEEEGISLEEDQKLEDMEERESLAERLEKEEEEVEQIYMGPPRSFFTVLGAILIPSIFIIICYLILKFFKF
jgi:cytochrome c-type biogenesis protein CcmH/NrfG